MVKLKLAMMALGRMLYELDLLRFNQAKRDKEKRADDIKRDPNAVATERFGDAAGRVRIDTDSD